LLADRCGFYAPGLSTSLRFNYGAEIYPVPIYPGKNNNLTFEGARGCKRRCTMCVIGWGGGPYRESKIDDVKALLRATRAKRFNPMAPDVSGISWIDDIRSEIAFSGKMLTGKNATNPNGMREFNLGLDGVSERLRRGIGKPRSDNDTVELIRAAEKNRINRFLIYCVVGLPGETREDRKSFEELIKRCRGIGSVFHLSLTHLHPIPGTPFEMLDAHHQEDVYQWILELKKLVAAWWPDDRFIVRTPKSRETHEFDQCMMR
jgi:radical SAM superfamily enzyme YgiQ (UPF0313 family)